MRWTFALLVVLLPSAAEAAAEAQGCGCAATVSPCAGYWNASAVFVGRVDSVKRRPGGRLVAFTVSESFRGVASSSVDVATGPPGHRCAVVFRVGRDYLVYASLADSGVLTANVCSRSRGIEDAASDVSYARAVKEEGKKEGKKDGRAASGSISGQVRLARVDLTGRAIGPPTPLPGIVVRIGSGGREQSAVTTQGGDFSVPNESAGTHVISVDLPGRFFTPERIREVRLADVKACVQADVTVYDNGRVSGRVLDAGGRAVPGLTIELATPNLRHQRRSITDRDGRFDLRRVPAGRFVLRAGVGKLVTLSPVRLGPGAHAAFEALRLPPGLNYTTLSGFVLRRDGTPAEGARVYLKGVDAPGRILTEAATADFLGKFVIAGVAGAEYELFAELANDHHLESSEPLRVTAAAGERPPRLVVRRRY